MNNVSNKHDRRHSGRVAPHSTLKRKKKKIIDECLEPQEYWDDWVDYRDGFRGYNDHTKKRNQHCWLDKFFNISRWNKKIKKLLKRRKQMKKCKNR